MCAHTIRIKDIDQQSSKICIQCYSPHILLLGQWLVGSCMSDSQNFASPLIQLWSDGQVPNVMSMFNSFHIIVNTVQLYWSMVCQCLKEVLIIYPCSSVIQVLKYNVFKDNYHCNPLLSHIAIHFHNIVTFSHSHHNDITFLWKK